MIHAFHNSGDPWDHRRKKADLVPALLELIVYERDKHRVPDHPSPSE